VAGPQGCSLIYRDSGMSSGVEPDIQRQWQILRGGV
jgi:hypothetical protein